MSSRIPTSSSSSHQDSPSRLSPASISSSEGNYIGHQAQKGHEVEHYSDVQRNSYGAPEAESHRQRNHKPCNNSTITDGFHYNQFTEVEGTLVSPGYAGTAESPGNVHYFTEHDTPCSNLHNDTRPDDRQRMAFSTDACASIGSHFQLDDTQGLEENFFMDPLFVQDLSDHAQTTATTSTTSSLPVRSTIPSIISSSVAKVGHNTCHNTSLRAVYTHVS